MQLSMLCPRGGGPRDRVGTLIRNRNLESNFLALGVGFQFKVPHLGEGFEFIISHETENFKPSDHEVKNRCLHACNKTFNDRAAPVKGSGKVCSFYKKIYILIKPRKQASI